MTDEKKLDLVVEWVKEYHHGFEWRSERMKEIFKAFLADAEDAKGTGRVETFTCDDCKQSVTPGKMHECTWATPTPDAVEEMARELEEAGMDLPLVPTPTIQGKPFSFKRLARFVLDKIAEAKNHTRTSDGEIIEQMATNHAAGLARVKGQQAEADAEIIETMKANQAAALKSARREALVDACKAVCEKCSKFPKTISGDTTVMSRSPCNPIRRLIAAMDSDAGKGGA